jgi:anti-sigma regulatory factor (Ser/Thr protein kinase)
MTTIRDVAAQGRTHRLAAMPTAPRLARVFVRQVARDWKLPEQCAETVELLVSELVTNAVKQTGRVVGPPTPGATEHVAVVVLRLRVVGTALRIEVWDNDPMPPKKADQDPDSENGRGLVLVEALSEQWGCYVPTGGGKVVWCEVKLLAHEEHEPGELESVRKHKTMPLPQRVPGESENVARVNLFEVAKLVNVAVLRRVLVGLQALQ